MLSRVWRSSEETMENREKTRKEKKPKFRDDGDMSVSFSRRGGVAVAELSGNFVSSSHSKVPEECLIMAGARNQIETKLHSKSLFY